MGTNWKNPCAKRNSQMQNYELIYTQVLSDLHSPRTNFGKKVYILALCVYINPKMSSKNRPLQLYNWRYQSMSYTDNLNEVILQSSVIILTLKDRQSITMGLGAIS